MSAAQRLALVMLTIAALGPPITETWRAVALGCAALAVACSDLAISRRRLLAAVATVLVAVGTRAMLPRADIAEGHNAFLVIGDGEPIERALPPPVFHAWRERFDRLYPPDREPYEGRSQWRLTGVPARAFTTSTDALWRSARYSRQVDAIAFGDLGEFRGGFANEVQYNFWSGELRRETMPYFVMYEWSPASVGSALGWTGQVFWQRADGGYQEIVHETYRARAIGAEDVGRRTYMAFFPAAEQRVVRLERSWSLALAAAVEAGVAFAAVLALLALTVRPRWRAVTMAISLFLVAYVVMAGFVAVSEGKYLGRDYPPHGGGDDGLVHDGWGRTMAFALAAGDPSEAMRGLEDVYWFTPGTRYVRMVEKAIFGDTNHLFALLVALVPVAVYAAVRSVAGSAPALGMTAAFLLAPVGQWAFVSHLANAKLGYGDALACGMFLAGITLLLRAEPRWGGRDGSRASITAGGALLAASMSIRPNYVFAVIWLGAAFAWASSRQGAHGRVAAVALGLALALWLPFHNWHYGGEFYLISRSGATVSVPLGPGDYWAAAQDLVTGAWSSEPVTTTARQVSGWLANPGLILRPVLVPLAWAVHAVQLLALLATTGIAVLWLAGRLPRREVAGVIAVGALLAHLPMLFIFTTHYRYATLAWTLSTLAVVAFAGARKPSVVGSTAREEPSWA